MAKLSTDELLDAFKEMTLIELSEFVKTFEDVFDVKAAAPVAAAGPAQAGPAAEVNKIADLESREVLLAKLAGAMKGNLSKAAATFQAPLSQAVRLVDALRAEREKDGSAEAA